MDLINRLQTALAEEENYGLEFYTDFILRAPDLEAGAEKDLASYIRDHHMTPAQVQEDIDYVASIRQAIANCPGRLAATAADTAAVRQFYTMKRAGELVQKWANRQLHQVDINRGELSAAVERIRNAEAKIEKLQAENDPWLQRVLVHDKTQVQIDPPATPTATPTIVTAEQELRAVQKRFDALAAKQIAAREKLDLELTAALVELDQANEQAQRARDIESKRQADAELLPQRQRAAEESRKWHIEHDGVDPLKTEPVPAVA